MLYIFEKDDTEKKVVAKSANKLGVKTFGTSVEYILDELFKYNQSIGDWANQKLIDVDFSTINNEKAVETVKKELKLLGHSIEKDLVLMQLNKIANS